MSDGYKVYIYAVVWVPVQLDAIEASNHKEAIKAALQKVDLDRDFRRGEYADEILSFMVDAPNDPTHALSKNFDADEVEI